MKKLKNWAIEWIGTQRGTVRSAYMVVGSELGGPEERNHEVGFLL